MGNNYYYIMSEACLRSSKGHLNPRDHYQENTSEQAHLEIDGNVPNLECTVFRSQVDWFQSVAN